MSPPAARTVRAIASQFALGGTDELENRRIFSIKDVADAGGLRALKDGAPRGITVTDIKRRMFSD